MMDVTAEQALDTAIREIGNLTLENRFLQSALAAKDAELEQFKRDMEEGE